MWIVIYPGLYNAIRQSAKCIVVCKVEGAGNEQSVMSGTTMKQRRM